VYKFIPSKGQNSFIFLNLLSAKIKEAIKNLLAVEDQCKTTMLLN